MLNAHVKKYSIFAEGSPGLFSGWSTASTGNVTHFCYLSKGYSSTNLLAKIIKSNHNALNHLTK